MNKKMLFVILGILIVIGAVLILGSVFFQSNILISDTNSPICGLTKVAGYEYSFKTLEQGNLNVLHYSQPGSKTGNAFYFGYVTFGSSRDAQEFFNKNVESLKNFSNQYPDKSQTINCTISNKEGICGVYQGKIDAFVWVDDFTYKIINNFGFATTSQPNQQLEEIVATLSKCNPYTSK